MGSVRNLSTSRQILERPDILFRTKRKYNQISAVIYVRLLSSVRNRLYGDGKRPADRPVRVGSIRVWGESSMSAESADQTWDRFNQIVGLKQDMFCYQPMREAIADELECDKQFRVLLVLSEQSRQFVAARESRVGCDDSMRSSIADFGETLDEAIHRRADEIITEVCASYVRQDDRWIVDDPDSVDATEMQASFDGIEQALHWLDDHEEITERLDITYPEDKW